MINTELDSISASALGKFLNRICQKNENNRVSFSPEQVKRLRDLLKLIGLKI